jgi:hypothetical protein
MTVMRTLNSLENLDNQDPNDGIRVESVILHADTGSLCLGLAEVDIRGFRGLFRIRRARNRLPAVLPALAPSPQGYREAFSVPADTLAAVSKAVLARYAELAG